MGGVNVDAGAHAATVLQLDRVHVTQQASAHGAAGPPQAELFHGSNIRSTVVLSPKHPRIPGFIA